jgi:hypothetical protein
MLYSSATLSGVAGDEPGKESLKTETSFPDRRKRGYEVQK